MPLIHQVVQPFVQQDIPAPSGIQLMAVRPAQSFELDVTMITRKPHGLGQLPIQVEAYLDIGIRNADIVFAEEIGKRHRDCVSASLKDLDMQVTISRNGGSIVPVETIQFRNQLKQSKIVAFIKCHQANEAFWPDDRLRNELILLQHALNISQHLADKRYANLVPKMNYWIKKSGSHSAFNTGSIKNSARNFLDRKLGRVNVRHIVLAKYFSGFPQFIADLLCR